MDNTAESSEDFFPLGCRAAKMHHRKHFSSSFCMLTIPLRCWICLGRVVYFPAERGM